MKKRLAPLSLILVLASCGSNSTTQAYLSADSEGTATISIYKNNQYQGTNRYLAPKNVELKYSYQSLSGKLYDQESVLPSLGSPKLLVIPVHISGSDYKSKWNRSNINSVFFGNMERDGLGYYSVSEFYEKSSFGKFELTGEVTDWYETVSAENISGDLIESEILPGALAWAESQGVNLSDYDYDGDGNIDGVFLVYDHFSATTVWNQVNDFGDQYSECDVNGAFTSLVSWDKTTSPDISHPTSSGYAWNSFDAMFTSYCDKSTSGTYDLRYLDGIPLDSHAYIKQVGRLLGLSDLTCGDSSSYSPLGHSSLMDNTAGDLDSYSKMLLGWVTPYVVYGRSEILLPSATSSDHSVIIIPSEFETISSEVESVIKSNKQDGYKYELNPFGEYILIDLYTPDGLNTLDVENPINGNRSLPTNSGVRIYHVDSRLFTAKVITYASGTNVTYTNYHWNGETLKTNEILLQAISNSRDESTAYKLNQSFDYIDQIRLLESSGINSFSSGGVFSNNTLWNTRSDAFDINNFGYQFFNSNYRFNDGEDIPFNIEVTTLKGVL